MDLHPYNTERHDTTCHDKLVINFVISNSIRNDFLP
jgi:hypothetical protein